MFTLGEPDDAIIAVGGLYEMFRRDSRSYVGEIEVEKVRETDKEIVGIDV